MFKTLDEPILFAKVWSSSFTSSGVKKKDLRLVRAIKYVDVSLPFV